MKKQILSAVLAGSMVLTMAPAALAVDHELPADVQTSIVSTPDDESGQEQSTAAYELTATNNIDGTVVAGQRYENGVSATLKNTASVAGISDAVLKFKLTEQPEGSNPQILGKDSENTEWNLAETGQWGPASGFSISANYNATTNFTVQFDKAGTYTAEFKLVSVAKPDEVLATGTMTIEVAVSEDSAVQVEYTKDGESKTAYYTGENNDDRNEDHFWDVISDLSSGYLDADTDSPITVTLLKDIALENTTILVDAEKNVTINGNGHTITATLKKVMETGTAGADAVSITNDSGLTLNNVKLDIKAADDAVTLSGETSTQGIYNGGKLALTGGTEVTVNGVSKDGINGGGEVTISGEDTKLEVANVGGSAMKFSDLTVNDGATINISNTPNHGISGANVTIQNATISVDDADLIGIAATGDVSITGKNTNVTVQNSGSNGTGYPAVRVNGGFTMTDSAKLTMTENGPAETESSIDFNAVRLNAATATATITGATLNGGIDGSTVADRTGGISVSNAIVVGNITNGAGASTVLLNSQISKAPEGATVIGCTDASGEKIEDSVSEGVVAVYNGTPYTSLKEAVEAATGEDAKVGDITLVADVSVTEKISISKDVTIIGNEKTITGKTDSTDAYFEITGGTLNISNAKLTGFGDTAGTLTGYGVFKIPSTATNAKIIASGLTVEKFNRAAFDVRNGAFEIKDCVINCDNGQESALTKGIVAGYDKTGTVTGSVEGCTITGSNSTYEGWSSNGIEISAGATVTISNTKIDSMKGGISIARNYGHGEAKVTLEDCTVTGEDYALRIFESNNTNEPVEGSSASLTVQGGTYTGDVRISRKDVDANGENNANGSTITVTGGSFDSSVAQYADSSLKFEAVTADGKQFTYHKTVEEAITAAGSGGNISLIAGETAEKADTVTLDYGYDNIKYTVKIPAGEKFTLPTADRTGYTFQGWYLNNSKITEYTATQEGGQAVIITAQWSKNGGSSGGGGGGGSSSASYAITVDKTTGGTVKVNPTRAEKGDTVTITVNPNSGYELDTLTVTDKDGDELSLTEKSDNKFTFKMPGSKVTIEATFTKIGTEVEPQPLPFYDVAETDYFYDAVQWAVENNVTAGIGNNAFGPNVICTRAQMVTFLWRANGSPKATGTNPFTDVQSGAYYYDAVLWAVEKGITSGTSATTFSPDMTVTRGQTVTFLHRANGSPAASGNSPFTDVAADTYYAVAVQWAVAESITAGTSATTFSPDAACTRGQIVTFLYRDMA
ncbi:MAG: S-layer homology domain-containing protein [Clostridiaceae bacterium]|nr:S-layer homology domain-containing protein [Clostridiaceae bacterium]